MQSDSKLHSFPEALTLTLGASPKLEGDNCCSLLGQPPAQVLPAPRIACREDLVEGADAALRQLPLERHPLPQAARICTATTASMFMQDWKISSDSQQ